MFDKDLKLTIRILQGTGFYPLHCGGFHEGQFYDRLTWLLPQRFVRYIEYLPHPVTLALTILTLMYISFNGILLSYNLYAIHYYYTWFGLWDAETIMMVISGMKPIQALINLICFLLRRQKHAVLVSKMESLDAAFRERYAASAPVYEYSCLTGAVTAVVALSCLGLRAIQFIIRHESFGASFLNDFSFLFVMALGLWQTLPLWYFHVVLSLILHWLAHFNKLMVRHRHVRYRLHQVAPEALSSGRELEYLTDTYFQITAVIKSADRFFNLFVLFSMARCVITLCLTIYFPFEAKAIIELPPDMEWRVRMDIYSNIGWSVLEILLALSYVWFFAYDGIRVNESSRCAIKPILNFKANSDEDRYQVFLLTKKADTKSAWCISAWRAFPLERSFVITLISGIITYVFLIHKMKQETIGECETTHLMNQVTKSMDMGNFSGGL